MAQSGTQSVATNTAQRQHTRASVDAIRLGCHCRAREVWREASKRAARLWLAAWAVCSRRACCCTEMRPVLAQASSASLALGCASEGERRWCANTAHILKAAFCDTKCVCPNWLMTRIWFKHVAGGTIAAERVGGAPSARCRWGPAGFRPLC